MPQFRKVLAYIGDEPVSPALARAAAIATRDGARLTLIAVVEDVPWYTRLVSSGAEEHQAALVRERTEKLEALARSSGVSDVSVRVQRGQTYLETVRDVLREGHDLLVKDAEPSSRSAFGSLDLHLARGCPCPVWLVRAGKDGGPAIRRILAPVNPAPEPDETEALQLRTPRASEEEALNLKILELATDLACREGARLDILHAWSVPGEDLLRHESRLSGDQVAEYVEAIHAEARRVYERLLARCPAGPEGRAVHLVKGDAADAIASFVEREGIDLLVMGTVAQAGIPGLFIGGTAEAVLQRIGCSVLLLKPEGFVSPVSPVRS